jgi:hypothetical protein
MPGPNAARGERRLSGLFGSPKLLRSNALRFSQQPPGELVLRHGGIKCCQDATSLRICNVFTFDNIRPVRLTVDGAKTTDSARQQC